MTLVFAWLRAFVLTLVVELLVAVPLLGRAGSRGRRVACVCVAQLATHPLVWFMFPLLLLSRMEYLVIAESFAVLIELVIYRLVFSELTYARALGISALANGCSLTVGLLLR